MNAWTDPIGWNIHPREIRGLGQGDLCGLLVNLDADTDHVVWKVSIRQKKITGGREEVRPRSKAITQGIRLIRAAVARILGHGPPPIPRKKTS